MSEAYAKVEQLMDTLDRVRRYRAFIPAASSLLIYTLSAVAALLLAVLVANFARLFFSLDVSFLYPPVFILSFALIIIGMFLGVRKANARIAGVRVGEWKSALSQNLSGAFRVLSDIDWETQLEDIKQAKTDLIQYALLKTMLYWLLSFLLAELFNFLIVDTLLSGNINFIFLGVVTLLISIVITSEDTSRAYRGSRSLETLYWQLRSFYGEFKQKEREFGNSEQSVSA